MNVPTLVTIVGLAVWPSQEAFRAEPQVARKIQEARKAVEETPTSNEAWGHLGLVLHAHEQNEGAVAAYERALELASNELRWAYLLARVLENYDLAVALAASGDLGGALEQVHAAQSFGHAVPNDFLATLTQRMPEPRPH